MNSSTSVKAFAQTIPPSSFSTKLSSRSGIAVVRASSVNQRPISLPTLRITSGVPRLQRHPIRASPETIAPSLVEVRTLQHIYLILNVADKVFLVPAKLDPTLMKEPRVIQGVPRVPMGKARRKPIPSMLGPGGLLPKYPVTPPS
jgi:hypothetical protein